MESLRGTFLGTDKPSLETVHYVALMPFIHV